MSLDDMIDHAEPEGAAVEDTGLDGTQVEVPAPVAPEEPAAEGDDLDAQTLDNGYPAITGAGDLEDDLEPPAEPADTAPASPPGAAEGDDSEKWFERFQQVASEHQRLLEQLQRQSASMPGPGAGYVPPMPGVPPMAPVVPQSNVPAVPTLEQLAEEMGTLTSDPAVRRTHDALRQAAEVQRRLEEQERNLQPLVSAFEQSRREQQIATSFEAYVNDTQRLHPNDRDWARANYAGIRAIFGKRTLNWADATQLYLNEMHKANAPSVAYEQGVRDATTANARRVQRGIQASVTAAAMPSNRRTQPKIAMTIDEAFAQAKAQLAKR